MEISLLLGIIFTAWLLWLSSVVFELQAFMTEMKIARDAVWSSYEKALGEDPVDQMTLHDFAEEE